MKLEVNEENIRIDKYLANNTDYSRTIIENMIKDEYVLVNDKPTKASYKTKINDIITIKEGYIKETDIKPVEMDIEILYEDNDIIIVNKPSGIVVHPGNGNKEYTLVQGLMNYTNELSTDIDNIRPGIVHRIDKDTSGILVIAKNDKAHELLQEEFKNHSIKRTYIALLDGILPHNSVTIDAPIGRDINNRKKMTVTDKNSKNAITHLYVLKRYKENTLVKCQLETGRTHQIRVHTKYIGYPIHNDPVYQNKKCSEFGQFLHSYEIDFDQPITKKHINLTCELPKEFQDYLDILDKTED